LGWVAVAVALWVGVAVAVALWVGVAVAVALWVGVAVALWVGVGNDVDVGADVGVGVIFGSAIGVVEKLEITPIDLEHPRYCLVPTTQIHWWLHSKLQRAFHLAVEAFVKCPLL
jgi:hypothetical protein